MNNSKKKIGILKILKEVLPRGFKATPKLAIGFLLTDAFYSICSVAIVKIQQIFFDTVVDTVNNKETITSVIFVLSGLIIINIIYNILDAFYNIVPLAFQGKTIGYILHELYEKVGKLNPIVFENTDDLDNINKAATGARNAVDFICQLGHIFVYYGLYFVLMTIYLYRLNSILSIAILFVFVPTIISQIIRIKVFDNLEDLSAPLRREYDYYGQCLTGREYYKETRLLGAFSYLRKLYIETLDKIQHIRYKATTKTGIIDLGLSVIKVIGYGGVLYLLFYSLIQKDISVGAFAAVYASIGSLYDKMEEMMNDSISNMARNYGTISNYINFLSFKDITKDNIELQNELIKIDVNNVNFKYPLSKNNVLKNINLQINAGETVAFVGENGSGKTTLVRLLLGLYAPDEGVIMYNDKDISKYNKDGIFENSSAVFQKYQRYQMSLMDNILISNNNQISNDGKINDICKNAGVELDNKSYPDGLDTMLSREYGGVDLSGGQWQRVAIARAFYRNHKFIVLDEPTSAIDPFEETRIYNEFAELSKNKTAIIVTHRLGSVKIADKIVVLKDGEIVQIGNHKELIVQEGEYKRLYKNQEQWYVEN